MDKIEKGDALTKSKDLIAENIEKLKQLFPEAVAEGKIVWKDLQAILGEEIEEGEEYYRFTWAGKSKARMEAHKPSTGTLRPVKEESVNWDTTQNLYIEGDNLEVLKLLQKSYAGKIKMIYIDPPYNTGKDFVYRDSYKDNLAYYKEVTGQVGLDGVSLTTNTESEGRFHSNWLSMMFPRLLLSRNLLKQDGVIFISIDDNEAFNLKKICDEIYGQENFIASIAAQLNPRGRHLDKFIAKTHESVLIYGKNVSNSTTMFGIEKEGNMVKEYNKSDDRGAFRLLGLRNRNQAFNPTTRPKLYYPLFVNPQTKEVSIEQDDNYSEEALPMTTEGVKTCWTWGKDKVKNENALLIADKVNGVWQVFRKDYLIDDEGNQALTLAKSLWIEKEINNDYGKKSIKELFSKNIMDFPKSPDFIQKMIKCGTNKGEIILDFFAGSSTTAEAVMKENIKNQRQNKFILVQLPEIVNEKSEAYKAGYQYITDIGKERIKKIIDKQKKENPLLIDECDFGFKVFKLDNSNIKSWDGSPENLQQSLYDSVSNIKEGRTEEDVLYEILLKYGLNPTLPIEERAIAGKRVFNIGLGAMFICLADGITSAVAEGIGEWKEELQPEVCRVIFKDTGFTDVEKTNSVQTLRRFGIQEVRSI